VYCQSQRLLRGSPRASYSDRFHKKSAPTWSGPGLKFHGPRAIAMRRCCTLDFGFYRA